MIAKFYNETLSKLETAINELEIETDCSVQRMEAVIHFILEAQRRASIGSNLADPSFES
ncbi:hypothetical protein [Sphingobacterium siyangense]|uniref:hypothetical protein n=1 Tax=Sphingobacterium siyangense TaxID=459529 RepID=UPI0030164A24